MKHNTKSPPPHLCVKSGLMCDGPLQDQLAEGVGRITDEIPPQSGLSAVYRSCQAKWANSNGQAATLGGKGEGKRTGERGGAADRRRENERVKLSPESPSLLMCHLASVLPTLTFLAFICHTFRTPPFPSPRLISPISVSLCSHLLSTACSEEWRHVCVFLFK